MMTLDAIDQALNVALTGIIYGSGTWMACAFGLYVVTKQRKRTTAPARAEQAISQPVAVKPAAEKRAAEQAAAQLAPTKAADTAPGIEIIIEQPLLMADKPIRLSKQPVNKVAVNKEGKKIADKAVLPQPTQPTVMPISSPTQPIPKSIEIVCEPVNWKKWKVSDLRKASLAKVCGVRTRPIGSRRNLPKADLIAQYEQQLKRLTKQPPNPKLSEEVA